MSHTPETPYRPGPGEAEILDGKGQCVLLVVGDSEGVSRKDLIATLNGCAGLNPAAYRQVVEALTEIKQLLDTGQLVRNIDHDADADWHIRMTPFVKTINNVCIALALAEQTTHA